MLVKSNKFHFPQFHDYVYHSSDGHERRFNMKVLEGSKTSSQAIVETF